VYTQYSIHPVRHTPSRVYSQCSIHPVQCIPSTASSQDQLSPTPSQSLMSHLSSLSRWCCYPLSSFSWLWVKRWTESEDKIYLPTNRYQIDHLMINPNQALLQTHSIIASKFISTPAWSWAPSSRPNSLNNGFQVHYWTHSIMTSKFAQLWSLIACPPLLNHCIQVHLQTR